MFCMQCGKEIKDDVKFCPNCGTNINTQSHNQNKKNSGMVLVWKLYVNFWKNYFDFKGCASKNEFWCMIPFQTLFYIATFYINYRLFLVFFVFTILPVISICSRRLNDRKTTRIPLFLYLPVIPLFFIYTYLPANVQNIVSIFVVLDSIFFFFFFFYQSSKKGETPDEQYNFVNFFTNFTCVLTSCLSFILLLFFINFSYKHYVIFKYYQQMEAENHLRYKRESISNEDKRKIIDEINAISLNIRTIFKNDNYKGVESIKLLIDKKIIDKQMCADKNCSTLQNTFLYPIKIYPVSNYKSFKIDYKLPKKLAEELSYKYWPKSLSVKIEDNDILSIKY